jgi:hypothetical protein
MHLCFVDESGSPVKPGQIKPRFFVIAGLIIPEERWHDVANKLTGLKSQFHYRGELKWRFFAPQNSDHDNPMVNWIQEQRDHFRAAVFNLVTGDRSVNIVAGVSEAEVAYRLANVNSPSDIYFRTYKVVTERFQYLLQDITRTSGRRAHGIIVADHRGKGDDEAMRIQHQRLVEENRLFTSTYGNLIEGLFLTPSHLSVGVQLSDMVAGAVGRRFEANDERWYSHIVSAIRKSPTGQVDGYGIARFPKQGWTGPIP